MKNQLLSISFFIAFTLFLTSFQERNATQRISIVNDSVWDIREVYVSEVAKNKWQNNLVEGEMLSAGGGAIIIKTECGTYDIKIVDTDNHACIVKNVETCGNDKTITITDQSIDSCLND